MFLSTSLVITGAAAEEGAAAAMEALTVCSGVTDLTSRGQPLLRPARHCHHRFRHPRAHVKRRRAVSDAEIKQFSEKEAGPPTHWDQGTGRSTKCSIWSSFKMNLGLCDHPVP